MGYSTQQQDIDLLLQGVKDLSYVKLELLNDSEKIIDVLEGVLISDTFTINADSAVRRTYDCTLHVSNSSFFVGYDKKIWLDKRIRPYIGQRYARTGEIIYYPKGTYIMGDASYEYGATNHTVSLSCSDLMCLINGEAGGELTDKKMTINANLKARDCIILLLTEAGISKYIINDVDFIIPYNIESNAGETYYDIIKKILDLYPGYEFFVDVNGTFTIQRIPTTEADNIVLSDEILNKLVINENMSTSLKNIYNHIVVYGAEIDIDRYSDVVSYSSAVYTATFIDLATYENNTTYGIKLIATNTGSDKLSFNSLAVKSIMKQDGVPITAGLLKAGDICVFRYRQLTDDFLYLGTDQVYAEASDINPNSPYSIQRLGRKISHVADGYDQLPTNEAARLAALVELWKSTNRQNTMSLSMILIPFLDVNQKITYTGADVGTQELYITKNISGSTSSGTMSLEMIRYYSEYPDIV